MHYFESLFEKIICPHDVCEGKVLISLFNSCMVYPPLIEDHPQIKDWLRMPWPLGVLAVVGGRVWQQRATRSCLALKETCPENTSP